MELVHYKLKLSIKGHGDISFYYLQCIVSCMYRNAADIRKLASKQA